MLSISSAKQELNMSDKEYAEFVAVDTVRALYHAAVIYGVALALYWIFIG